MRKAGVLLPISSLPSPWGIGALGAAAREFIDFLAAAGQSFWQILPLGPTSYGDSPYQSFSSWAGNPYFIDLDDLAAEGLLERQEYQRLNWGEDPARVDYGLLYKTRYPVLRKACARLLERGDARFHSFCLGEADWLEDYALFMALKERFDGRSWQEWAPADPAAGARRPGGGPNSASWRGELLEGRSVFVQPAVEKAEVLCQREGRLHPGGSAHLHRLDSCRRVGQTEAVSVG